MERFLVHQTIVLPIHKTLTAEDWVKLVEFMQRGNANNEQFQLSVNYNGPGDIPTMMGTPQNVEIHAGELRIEDDATSMSNRQPTKEEVAANNKQLREFYAPLWDEMLHKWQSKQETPDYERIKTFVGQGWRPLGLIGNEELGITVHSSTVIEDYSKQVFQSIWKS